MADKGLHKKRKAANKKGHRQKRTQNVKRANARKRKHLRRKHKKNGLQLHFPKEKLKLAAQNPKEITRWTVEIVVVCLLAVILVLSFGQRVSIAGDAMSPALKNGDVLLINRLVYNSRKPERGEIIAFKPGGNENAHYTIKRVVGLPGETVQIKNGQVYINGEILVKNIYCYEITTPGVAEKPIELGENEYFVLGDNHESSDDSRMADVGNVHREDIYGKVWFVANFGPDFGFVDKHTVK
ncbi:signal peptidase I [Mediterraneibacter agrestimuris]|uniref:signal peptidase I n=1 Tax=Mediterraneibacter agrestimuris TaxID=2941333 RepID=UPI002042190D|nr:signal peptidase I [Mediterraneibacter agrestimuris]